MIGFFPEPFPDEPVYSLCARYRRRAGYRGRISTVRDLFGSATFKTIVDLPSRLDHLVTSLPPGHDYTADRLIDEHTMLPFYAPFITPERVARVRMEMHQSSVSGKVGSRAGVLQLALRLEYLQYCPMCIEEDRERCGEAYWHRIHQASGVKVCASHGVVLASSGIAAIYRADREEFVTLEELLPTAPARPTDRCDLSDRSREFYLAIARDVRWLLDQRGLSETPAALSKRYLNLLYDHGLSTSADVVLWRTLFGEIESHYGRDLLTSLNFRLEGQGRRFRYLFKGGRQYAYHPVHHLLFIHYLGCSAQDFFRLPGEKRQPFGSPPWPCLNYASEHYRELRIKECTVKDARMSKKDRQRNTPRRPLGEFVCDCGFGYRRIGPDTSEEDRYKRGRIAEFGKVWESKLRSLHCDGIEHTSEEIARRLGVSTRTLQAQEERLGLRSGKEGDGSGVSTSPILHYRERARLERLEKRRIYREQWLSAVQEDPQTDLLTLKSQLPAAYNWLRCNDYRWMLEHTPRRHNKRKPVSIDWQARDAELSVVVKRSAERLMKAPGRPRRVSVAAIARDTGKSSKLLNCDDRLPLTKQALMEVAESAEAWAIRRIQWAVDCYRREEVSASRGSLLRRANVSPEIGRRQDVLVAIEEGMRSLRLFSRKTD